MKETKEIKQQPEPKLTGPLQIDIKVLQDLRVYAAMNNVGMAETAEKAIRKFIK